MGKFTEISLRMKADIEKKHKNAERKKQWIANNYKYSKIASRKRK
ncbi:hypothetical protein [Clostridium akagii]|nr:hypothetical protein [Clostridium akagii]